MPKQPSQLRGPLCCPWWDQDYVVSWTPGTPATPAPGTEWPAKGLGPGALDGCPAFAPTGAMLLALQSPSPRAETHTDVQTRGHAHTSQHSCQPGANTGHLAHRFLKRRPGRSVWIPHAPLHGPQMPPTCPQATLVPRPR